MFEWFARLAFLVLLCPALAAGAETDVAALLRQADLYRRPAGPVRVETEVRQYRNGALDKERLYTVYAKPGRRSLVLMKSPSEIGQKVLMLGEKFWLLTPDSQRPLRITANQKLLGEASTGDIATMTWSEDYRGELVGEVDCPGFSAATVATAAAESDSFGSAAVSREKVCLRLRLTAAAPGVTYANVDLFLGKESKVPVKADLFVDSGKRAKEAWYLEDEQDGGKRIMAMLLIDDIQTTRRTVVRYKSMEAKECPDEFFNPAALVRNALPGW
ncbi:MAG: outer membrane lipoprotein-sorting protein [Zoogloeaceae bacterium]|jgi:hypothetical protein|nr:outer membrane lipoprotein-sorting protein [Zoogloeaceae bacterium]